MPIEVANSLGGPERVLGYVQPGQYVLFPGFYREGGNIVGVYCLPDNSGGEIYEVEPIYAVEDRVIPYTPEEIYTKERLVRSLETGKGCRREVRTESGLGIDLIFTHVVLVEKNK